MTTPQGMDTLPTSGPPDFPALPVFPVFPAFRPSRYLPPSYPISGAARSTPERSWS